MEKPQARPLPRRPATNQRHALPPKRRGEIAELAFMQKAVSLGFGVAKPWGDSDRYDYILDAGRRFWRVQVRSTAYESHRGYAVHTYVYVKRKMVALTADEIDCIIAYIVPARSLVRAPGRGLLALQESVVLSPRQQKRIALRELSAKPGGCSTPNSKKQARSKRPPQTVWGRVGACPERSRRDPSRPRTARQGFLVFDPLPRRKLAELRSAWTGEGARPYVVRATPRPIVAQNKTVLTRRIELLPDELFNKTLAQSGCGEMPAAKVNLGKYVFVAQHGAIRIDIDHGSVHLKESDHFRDIGFDHQGVRFSGSFVDIGSLGGNPIVLQIMPASFQNVTMHGLGMAMAG